MKLATDNTDKKEIGGRRSARSSLQLIYYLLAVFNLFAISSGLYLNHQLMRIYIRSIRENQEWTKRRADYSELERLALAVGEPANSVFDSRNIEVESERMHTALAAFNERMTTLREDLQGEKNQVQLAPIYEEVDASLKNLGVIQADVNDLADEAELTFSAFRKNQIEMTGEHMAAMNRKYVQVIAEMSSLRGNIGQIQKKIFEKDMAAADFLEDSEWIFGALIFLMVCGALVYGLKMKRQMEADEKTLEAEITERKQAGQALRESEELFRLLVEGGTDYAIFMLDTGSRIASWNEGARRLKGYRPDEIIGQHFSVCYTPEDIAQDKPEQALKIAAAEDRYEDECWIVHKDGSRFWANIIITALRDEAGGLRGFVEITRDITERKRAEETLRQSEQDYRGLFEQAHDAILVVALEQEIVLDVNERACEIYGFSRSEFIGMSLETISKDVARGKARVAETLERGDYLNFETVQYRKDGTEILLEINASTIRYQGQVAILSINRDITERKRAEEALKESQRKLEEAQRIAHVGHWERDLETGLVTWSDETYRIFGLPLQGHDLPLMEWQDMLHPEDRERVSITVEEAKRGLRRYDFEYRLVRPDGEVHFIHCQGDIVRDEQGRPRRAFGIVQDITERKRAEEALRLSEERFAKAFHANPDPISIIRHSDSIILEINDRWESIFGYTREEVIGRTAAELNLYVNPEERLRLRDLFKEQGFLREQEAACLGKDGDVRHISMSAEQIVINDEPCIIFLMRDITERKRAEDKYYSIFENAVEGIFQSTPDGRFLSVNPAMARMYGYDSPEEMIAERTDIERQHYVEPERRAELQRLLEKQEGIVHGFESEVYCKDGSKFWTSESVRAVRDQKGTLLYYEGFVKDMTERKRAQEKLRINEESYRRLVELSPDAILVHCEGKVDYVNPAGVRFFAATGPEQIIGMPVLELVHPDFRELVRERIRQTEEGRKAELIEEKHVRLDGKIVYTEVAGIGITYRGKQATQIIIRDITERVHAREARMQLQQRFLTAQEEERRRLSRELHDQMGQHLPALMLGLKALKDAGQSGPPADEVLQQLQDLAAHIARDAQRLARGLRPATLDDFGLRFALSNYVEEWSERYEIPVDFHSIGFEKDERLPSHIEITLYRIVQEALTNVVKHSQAEHVSLILERNLEDVLAVVEDDGKGFDLEAVKNTPISERRLGLLGMQERVELVGGTLEIESAPGAGTTVVVRLPT